MVNPVELTLHSKWDFSSNETTNRTKQENKCDQKDRSLSQSQSAMIGNFSVLYILCIIFYMLPIFSLQFPWLFLTESFALPFLTCRSYLHFSKFKWILPTSPGRPLNSIGIRGVLAMQVLAIQVGHVAAVIPPCAMVEWRTVVLGMIVVTVLGCKLHTVVFQQGVTWVG